MTTTPKLQSLAKAMAMLESGLEDGAGKLLTKVEALENRGLAALAKGNQRVDAKADIVGEIEAYVAALEGANGGPILSDSSAMSGASADAAAVTQVETAVPQDAPEKLDIHGVSLTQ